MRFTSLFFAAVCAFGASTTQVLPQLPVRFENPSGTRWSARGLGYSLAFAADATIFHLGERTLAMRLVGADPAAAFEAISPYSVPTQYFTPVSQGPVQSYRRLRRVQVYPGINVVFYGTGGNLEYDFVVAPGADPR